MFFKVPVLNGVLDIDYKYLEQGIQVSETEAYVKLREGFMTRGSWVPITEVQFEALKPMPGPGEPPETTEEKLARLEEQNLILMDALATTFEEILTLRAIMEGGTT